MILFDFSQPGSTDVWRAIDDRVMGGVSLSMLVSARHNDSNIAVFRGDVSLQNNGGFCSVRASLQQRIHIGAEQVCISCFNNHQLGAKTYWLNLRTDTGFDGLSYRAAFTPDKTITHHKISVAKFAPVFRGRAVPDAPHLQLDAVVQIGLMVGDGQTGKFELFIESVGLMNTSH